MREPLLLLDLCFREYGAYTGESEHTVALRGLEGGRLHRLLLLPLVADGTLERTHTQASSERNYSNTVVFTLVLTPLLRLEWTFCFLEALSCVGHCWDQVSGPPSTHLLENRRIWVVPPRAACEVAPIGSPTAEIW